MELMFTVTGRSLAGIVLKVKGDWSCTAAWRSSFLTFFLIFIYLNSLLVTANVGGRVKYSKRLHSMSETACTVWNKWTPDDELPEARNM